MKDKKCRFCGSIDKLTKAHRKTRYVKERDPTETYPVCEKCRVEVNKIMTDTIHKVKERGQSISDSSCIGTVPVVYQAGSYNWNTRNIPEGVRDELLEQTSPPKKGDYKYYFTMFRPL